MIVKNSRSGLQRLALPAVIGLFQQRPEWGVLRNLYASQHDAERVLNEFLTPLNNDQQSHYIGVVLEDAAQMVGHHGAELNASRAFQPEYGFDGIQLQVVSQGAEFPRGLIWSRVGVNCDIKTQRMKVSARVGVRGDASEVVKWRVGLVQTILRLERRIVVVKGDSKGVFRTWLPGPCKDGPKDYAESWYDPGAVASLKLKQFQLVDVSMMDQPGFTWSQKVTETVEAVNGGEAFRTWLVMQRTDGSRTHFLRMWEWHVDYTISPDNINRFGIVFDGFQQNATGAGAVLDGLNGKNQFQNEFRQEHTNVTSFDELRRMAVQHN